MRMKKRSVHTGLRQDVILPVVSPRTILIQQTSVQLPFAEAGSARQSQWTSPAPLPPSPSRKQPRTVFPLTRSAATYIAPPNPLPMPASATDSTEIDDLGPAIPSVPVLSESSQTRLGRVSIAHL
ncbi:hypothetical protein B0H19DRAFT_1263631 [Mycena capillaripes]|nr:hypothetical protein B0H19DRAFT_1263631 [Mycena capillaripes]